MARKKVLCSIFLLSALFCSMALTNVKGATTGNIYIDQYPPVGSGNIFDVDLDPGDLFNITVYVENIQNLFSYEFNIRWYGAVLYCNNTWEGDPSKGYNNILVETGYMTYFTPKIWNTPDAAGEDDYIYISDTLVGAPAGAYGDGLLAIIEFRVESLGRSGLVLFQILPVDSFHNRIEVTVEHGNFVNITWVDLGEPGDVNGDHKVDIADLYLIAKALGTTPSNTGSDPPGESAPPWEWNEYNPYADINGDDKVDIFDLSIAASFYGSHS